MLGPSGSSAFRRSVSQVFFITGSSRGRLPEAGWLWKDKASDRECSFPGSQAAVGAGTFSTSFLSFRWEIHMSRVTGIGGIFSRLKTQKHCRLGISDTLASTCKTGEAPPSAGLMQMASLWVERPSGPSGPPMAAPLRQAQRPSW